MVRGKKAGSAQTRLLVIPMRLVKRCYTVCLLEKAECINVFISFLIVFIFSDLKRLLWTEDPTNLPVPGFAFCLFLSPVCFCFKPLTCIRPSACVSALGSLSSFLPFRMNFNNFW